MNATDKTLHCMQKLMHRVTELKCLWSATRDESYNFADIEVDCDWEIEEYIASMEDIEKEVRVARAHLIALTMIRKDKRLKNKEE